MGTVGLAGVLCVLLAAQVMANSEVRFELAVGGDNHAPAIKAHTYTMFTDGNTADGQVFDNTTPDAKVTWEVRVSASGVQAAGNGAGYPIQGIANYVFDLELRAGTAGGPLVTNADFISTIHDGSTACEPSDRPLCPPCLAGASFAFAFNELGLGPARAIDPLYNQTECSGANPHGGPNLGVFLFPTIEPGKLLGMGGGYSQWKGSGLGTKCAPGLGMAMLPDGVHPGLGDGPVNEGQVDVSGLSDGTYVLVLVPGDGINILRGDITLWQTNQNAFATEVDTGGAIGDSITFELRQVVPPSLHLVSAKSRKTHDIAGPFDINLPLDGAACEPRQGGPTQVILTFDAEVEAIDGTVDVGTGGTEEVVLSSGSGSAAVAGSQITLTLSGVADQSCLSISLQGLQSTGGGALEGDTDVKVRVLYGDVDVTGTVNIVDLNLTKVSLFQTVNSSTFLRDVDLSATLNIEDLQEIKLQLFHQASCP